MPTKRFPFSLVPQIWTNWITLLGAVLALSMGAGIILFLLFEFVAGEVSSYARTMVVVGLPGLFIVGLLLIPLGVFVERRRVARRGAGLSEVLPQALTQAMLDPRARRLILFFGAASLVNVIVLGIGGQEAISYMDSPKFCGTTCHTAMEPEWTSYNGSKHSHVACVKCHIGDGAPSEAKAKLNGLSQVWHVVTNSVERPIPTPIEHLRSARETCEHCHWPEKFNGGKLDVFPHFTADRDNSPTYNVFLTQVGGRNPKTSKYEGIHWHTDHKAAVRYQYLDRERTQIGKITVLEEGTVVAEYLPPEKSRNLPVLGEQTMDCTDCHNRPTHVFDATPQAAVDRVMGAGMLDPKAPWLAKAAADVLSAKDVPEGSGAPYFRKALEITYASSWPDVKPSAAALDQAAVTLAEVYSRNIFPKMAVTWGTHRSRLGHHQDYDKATEIGCFRCHDGEHVKTTPEGKKVTLDNDDCDACHNQIVGGEDPATFAADLKQLLPK